MARRKDSTDMDGKALHEVLARLGDALAIQATICLVGDAPGILLDQPDRTTDGLDAWGAASSFDPADLADACHACGVRYNPLDGEQPGSPYLRVDGPNAVRLPGRFDVELIWRYGNLSVTMPDAAMLVASKLVRGEAMDVRDVVWLQMQQGLGADAIRAAVDALPDPAARLRAKGNLFVIDLVCPDRRGR
jgi:hypothetical protein